MRSLQSAAKCFNVPRKPRALVWQFPVRNESQLVINLQTARPSDSMSRRKPRRRITVSRAEPAARIHNLRAGSKIAGTKCGRPVAEQHVRFSARSIAHSRLAALLRQSATQTPRRRKYADNDFHILRFFLRSSFNACLMGLCRARARRKEFAPPATSRIFWHRTAGSA